MTNSISQAIDTIKSAIENNFSDEIKFVNFAKETATDKSKDYPRVQFYFGSGTAINENVNLAALQFQFLDQAIGQNNNDEYRKEIISDMFQTASRVIEYLKRKESMVINQGISITPFDSRWKDGLGGVEFTLIINIAKPCLAT